MYHFIYIFDTKHKIISYFLQCDETNKTTKNMGGKYMYSTTLYVFSPQAL